MKKLQANWKVLVIVALATSLYCLYAEDFHGAYILQGGDKELAMHHEYARYARTHKPPVVFFGDSITFRWNKNIWEKRIAPLGAAKFGYNGDDTESLLWRMEHGELDGQPKVAVVLIGTNDLVNLGRSPEQVADNINDLIATIRRLSPRTRILLMGVFERGANPDEPCRKQVKELNAHIAAFGDHDGVRFLDISDAFVAPDGSPSTALQPDYLHLSAIGYRIWADAVERPLHDMLQEAASDDKSTTPQ